MSGHGRRWTAAVDLTPYCCVSVLSLSLRRLPSFYCEAVAAASLRRADHNEQAPLTLMPGGNRLNGVIRARRSQRGFAASWDDPVQRLIFYQGWNDNTPRYAHDTGQIVLYIVGCKVQENFRSCNRK